MVVGQVVFRYRLFMLFKKGECCRYFLQSISLFVD